MRGSFATYGLSIAAVLVAALVRWLLNPLLDSQLPFFTFYFATIFAAWCGGIRPGVVSVVLGIGVAAFFFCDPRHSFHVVGLTNQLDMLRFIGVGIAVSLICEMLHRSRYLCELQREQLRVTFASIGDAVITTDTEGRITNINAVAESLTEWTVDAATGQPLDAVFRIVNEETRQTVENPAYRALQQGMIVGLANHTILIAKDGTERPIDDSAAPIKDEDGHVIGCVLIFRDISERRRIERDLEFSEERFRSLVTATISVVWTTDATGQFVTEQPSWSEFTGQTWDEYRAFGWANAVHPDDRERVRSLWEAARAERGMYKSEGRLWHGDSKTYRHFMARGVPVIAADGSVREWIGKCMDIEEERQAERKIYDLLTELKAADRRKDEFLAMLAHELRGPLAPLNNMLALMNRADRDGDLLKQAREMMERQLAQMVRLVDDLLDVSRITRNKLELRKDRVELASVVHQSVEVCRPLAERANHEVSVTLPSQPIYLHADPVRLAQIFSNLLNNACKYTEPGGKIWLAAERQGSDVVVSIKDTGMGIPSDKLEIIFEMFAQVDRSLEKSQGGLGIGLTLVKRLVELHDGSIEVKSEGKGSEFIVRLPIVIGKLQAISSPPTSEKLPPPRRRILVVDDNNDSASSLAMLLKITGNETHIAHDGIEALEAAEKFLPEVVLLDIGLPKMSGYEVCRRIREQPWGKDMVLVALTGWGQDEDRRKSTEAGFDHHMVKPVDHAALMKLLAGSQAASG